MGACQHVIKYGLCLVMFEAHANDITGSGFDALTLVSFFFFFPLLCISEKNCPDIPRRVVSQPQSQEQQRERHNVGEAAVARPPRAHGYRLGYGNVQPSHRR